MANNIDNDNFYILYFEKICVKHFYLITEKSKKCLS